MITGLRRRARTPRPVNNDLGRVGRVMTMSKTTPLQPDRIGQFYGQLGDLFAELLGPNLHYGYWPDSCEHDSFRLAVEHLTDLMIEKVQAGPEHRVLDVGCGIGGPAIRLARATGAAVTGITVSARQVELATARVSADGMGEQVRIQYANAMDLPFPADSFDTAWALESIFHVPDRRRALEQLARVVRPGGRLVLTDYFQRIPVRADRKPLIDAFLTNSLISSLPRIDEYRHILHDSGFRLEEATDLTERSLRTSARRLVEEVHRNRRAFEQRLGPDNTDIFVYHLTSVAEADEIGYLILVATRATVIRRKPHE